MPRGFTATKSLEPRLQLALEEHIRIDVWFTRQARGLTISSLTLSRAPLLHQQGPHNVPHIAEHPLQGPCHGCAA